MRLAKKKVSQVDWCLGHKIMRWLSAAPGKSSSPETVYSTPPTILAAPTAPRSHGLAKYHQRASGVVKGVVTIIKVAIGMTVTAIHRNTKVERKRPMSGAQTP